MSVVDEHRHVVHLYRDDADLAEQVAPALASALGDGAVVVMVATATHRAAFGAWLADAGIDVALASVRGDLRCFDAQRTVADLIVDDSMDPAAFDRHIGALVRDAAALGRPVHVYGEMVALLWSSGLVSAAIELEQLWNALGERENFSLICAYECDTVGGDECADEFAEMCSLHSSVVDTQGAQNPADHRSELTREFLATPTSPGAARSFTTATLRAWDEIDLADDAALIVSELSSNAILHAESDFTVVLSRASDTIRIAVQDSGGGAVQPRGGEPTATSGRGLLIVDALAARWGWEHRLPGKRVWAELPRRSAG